MENLNHNKVNQHGVSLKNQEQNFSGIPPVSSSHNLKIIIVTLAVLLIGVLGAVGYYFFANKNNLQNNQPTPTENQHTSADNFIPTPITENLEIYLGKGWEDKYSLVNVQTGETKVFSSSGYTVALNQHEYTQFPKYLILQKDNDLFAYNLENNLSNSIFGSFHDLKLKKNEQAHIYPSITEKDKFFVVIHEYDPEEKLEMSLPNPLHTRSYTFDASTNKLVSVSNLYSSGCEKYDSKNKRFFTWPCGDGIGHSTPLSISDMSGKKQKEVITQEEFGLAKDNIGLVAVIYNNGLFFAQRKGAVDKVVVVDPQLPSPTKDTFVLSNAVKSQIIEAYPYSTTIAEDKNTIIIGGNDFILLLRFDSNKQITQSAYIPDKEIYGDFIYVYNGKLYYQVKDSIRVVNLDTWQIEKSIPSTRSEEVFMISLTK